MAKWIIKSRGHQPRYKCPLLLKRCQSWTTPSNRWPVADYFETFLTFRPPGVFLFQLWEESQAENAVLREKLRSSENELLDAKRSNPSQVRIFIDLSLVMYVPFFSLFMKCLI